MSLPEGANSVEKKLLPRRGARVGIKEWTRPSILGQLGRRSFGEGQPVDSDEKVGPGPCVRIMPYGVDLDVWACGPTGYRVCQHAGCRREAVVLCDEPQPGGGTCDVACCFEHSAQLGDEDLHFCREHAARRGLVVGVHPRVGDEFALCVSRRVRNAQCVECSRRVPKVPAGVSRVVEYERREGGLGCRWFLPWEALR